MLRLTGSAGLGWLLPLSLLVPVQRLQAQEVTIESAVAPVVDAIRDETAAQRLLPPPVSVRERLERMGRLDQAGRYHLGEIDYARLPPERRVAVAQAIAAALVPIDRANLAAFRAMIPESGWFTIAEVGEEASAAAFHIVQHGGDPALRKSLLPRLRPLAERGEIDGFDYAAMVDRVAVGEGRPQLYGTQFHCNDGHIVGYPLEDEAAVDRLRTALHFSQTYAESAAMHVGKPCAGP